MTVYACYVHVRVCKPCYLFFCRRNAVEGEIKGRYPMKRGRLVTVKHFNGRRKGNNEDYIYLYMYTRQSCSGVKAQIDFSNCRILYANLPSTGCQDSPQGVHENHAKISRKETCTRKKLENSRPVHHNLKKFPLTQEQFFNTKFS